MDAEIGRIELDPQAVRRFMLSDEVANALLKEGGRIADEAEPEAYKHLKGPRPKSMYAAKIKRLRNTNIAIIHPTNRAAFAIEAKHRLLAKVKGAANGS